MVVASSDFDCGASGAEVDGVTWCVGVGGCSVAELTDRVEAPTFDTSVVKDCACVICASGDCCGGASGAEVDGVTWCVGAGGCSISELTRTISSPTCDASIVEYCAGMKTTVSRNAHCGAAGAEVDGVTWCVGVGGCSVSELPIVIHTPACDASVVEYCAGMRITACDRNWCKT